MKTARCVHSSTHVRLRAHRRRLASTCVGALALLSTLVGASAPADAATAYAVGGNTLIEFDTEDPAGTAVSRGTISGLGENELVFDLDIRPRNSLLYALTIHQATGLARVYRVTFAAGQAPVATQVTTNPLATGPFAAIDFDPVNDRLRIIGQNQQSFRLNVDSGATENAPLPNVPESSLVGLAFTNNFDAPSTATLYGIRTGSGQEVITIGTPNGSDGGATGTIASVSFMPSAPEAPLGFDIVANTDEAYMLRGVGGVSSELYRINLGTGGLESLGTVGGAAGVLRGLAIHSRASLIHGIDTSNRFVTFLSARPNEYRQWNGAPGGTAQPIAPALSGAALGMDVRPSTGEIYVLAAGTPANLYKVHPATAASTFVGTVQAPLTNSAYAMYFEMQGVDEQIHLIGNQGQNLLINPNNGQTILTLGTFAPTSRIVAATRQGFGDVLGIDSATDRLVVLQPFNGDPPPATDVFPDLGVDTDDRATLDHAPADGAIFASLTAPATSFSNLYFIRRGQPARRIGSLAIGADSAGLPLVAMTVAAQGRIQFVAPKAYTVNEGPGGVLGQPVPISVERIAGHDGPITVEVAATTGTATEGADYTKIRSVTTFLPNTPATQMVVPVLVKDDTLIEPDETIGFEIKRVAGAAQLVAYQPAETALLTIHDEDAALTPTIQITSPTTAGSIDVNSWFIALGGVATDPDGTITSVTWTTNHGASGTASSSVAASTEWLINVVPIQAGVNVITVTAQDNTGRTATATLTVNVGELTYLMAEGATGFFNLDIAIANPSGMPADVEVEFFDEHGAIPGVVQRFPMAAGSRRTLTVNDLPGMDGRSISTIVRAKHGLPLLVERTMEWDRATRYASATDHAVDGAARKWFFAEGAQGAFNTYLLLVNPNPTANVAHVRYLRDNESVVTVDYPLVGLQRFTVDIGNTTDFPAHAGLQQRVFGIEVTFDLPGVAERAMYFGYPPLWRGGHESAGVNQPSRSWFLAEGATGFFQTYVLLANPSAQDATINVDFLLPSGPPVTMPAFQLKAGQRTSIDVAGVDPRLAATAVSTRINSSVPIVVERAQYWPSGAFENWQEAHNSFGITEPATRWGLAEGRVGGSRGYATYILVANPNAQPANATIKFLKENGDTFTKDFVVPANGRFTVFGDLPIPELEDETFGAVVSADRPIVVERAMYSNALGITWQAGSNATATRLPSVP